MQMMLSSKGESARKYLETQIREITLELLKITRETENDDLASVMQKIVCTYTEQLVPVAVDICQHLVGTFAQVTVWLNYGWASSTRRVLAAAIRQSCYLLPKFGRSPEFGK